MSNKVICVVVLFLCSCLSHADSIMESKLIDDYFHMSTEAQIREFKNHTLDEQYKLFIFGNQVVHPPAIYLARPFAEQGPIIVPFLTGKLKATKKEFTIRDIALVLRELARLKLYNFSANPEPMGLLDQRARDMHGIWKETTLEMIDRLDLDGKIDFPYLSSVWTTMTTSVVNMNMYRVSDRDGRVFAFEIESVYIGVQKIVTLLRSVHSVSDLRVRKLFGSAPDVHVEFVYRGNDFIV